LRERVLSACQLADLFEHHVQLALDDGQLAVERRLAVADLRDLRGQLDLAGVRLVDRVPQLADLFFERLAWALDCDSSLESAAMRWSTSAIWRLIASSSDRRDSRPIAAVSGPARSVPSDSITSPARVTKRKPFAVEWCKATASSRRSTRTV
jgi:hypothetical protein